MLNFLYYLCLKFDFNGILFDAFISLFMHVIIGFKSYTLSAIMNLELYFFRLLISAIAIFVLCLGPFTACE